MAEPARAPYHAWVYDLSDGVLHELSDVAPGGMSQRVRDSLTV